MEESTFTVTPNAVVVPILALITLIIDTPPFVWHVRNHNLAASSLVFWVLISNLMNFINPLIWPTDDMQHWWHGQILCDIEIKLQMAVNFGVVGSMACIMRNLAKALDTEHTVLSPSKAQRRTQTIVSCLFCFGGSIYVMLVHYIVQPNRYYILALSGCTSSFDNSWPKLVLVFIWPPIVCLVDAYYSVLVIIRMRRYRKNFSEILESSNSNLTKSRFLRLFLLSIALIVTFIPLQFYVLFVNSAEPALIPYSWDLIHSPQWGDIVLIPTDGKLYYDRWIQIALGYGVFLFFGLGQDAQILYRKWLLKIGFGRVFPGLHRQPNRRAILPTSGRTDSFGRKTRSFFKDRLFRISMLSLHSKDSTLASTASLSPVEQQGGFGHLSTINEHMPRAGDALSASTDSMEEKDSPTQPPHSWLTNFLVGAHLSAPNRRWEASSNGGRMPHVGSNSSHQSDSTIRKDYA
ncbi:MAG: a-factor receptor [Alectoria fallacina]|uniref:A-factor receptor n=1 Tax=Alectoria fallacina TaxID=1903189 RepID=A0A8H3F2S6_9LECA|nr:MAG: a-factor receptor [Alectoria fallacina]